jgi:uncharacterized protein (TIGR00369 family)
MSQPDLKLDPAGVNAILMAAFPDTDPSLMALVQEAEPGRVLVMRPYGPGLLRPGNIISGPTLMTIADTGAYALVLAHIGDQKMAVTSSLVMNFLRGAAVGDIWAECRFLRLGRRIAVCDVHIWTESRERPAAQATVTYAIP